MKARTPILKVPGELTDAQICDIVLDWYTNGMYAPILQSRGGLDLEELIEPTEDHIIKKLKLTPDNVRYYVLFWYNNIYDGSHITNDAHVDMADLPELKEQSYLSIPADLLIQFKGATTAQKNTIRGILISNYTDLVNDFVEDADYATTTKYWKDFTPSSYKIVSAKDFIKKYGK